MRNAFFDELGKLFAENEKAVFITADLGYKLFDHIAKFAPERTINFGIREAGMIGFAAGLAKGGMLPFVYSIAPFATLRCLEQIKIDLCYNGQKVIVVGVGGGVAYGPNGPTHHGADDVGVLSCLPGLTVLTPSDAVEVRACVRAALGLPGPAYLRLGRNGEPAVHDPAGKWPDISAPMIIRDGGDGAILTNGFILHEVLAAAEILKEKGVAPKIIQIATFRPFPDLFVENMLAGGKPVMTVEESIPTGGLGDETAKIIARSGKCNPFASLSLPLEFPGACYGRAATLKNCGLDPASIAMGYEGLLK